MTVTTRRSMSALKTGPSNIGISSSTALHVSKREKGSGTNEELKGESTAIGSSPVSDVGGGSSTVPNFSAFAYDPSASASSPGDTSMLGGVDAASAGVGQETPTRRRRSSRKRTGSGRSVGQETRNGPTSKSKNRREKKMKRTAKSTAEQPSAKAGEESKAPTTPVKKRFTKTPSPSTSSSKKRLRIEPGSLTPPSNWESTYSLVEELRRDRTAPVDTDGGHALPQKHRGEVIWRYQVLVALMLSSQTKDAVVGETMRSLQKHGLDVENIHRTSAEDLNALIRKVGFHNNKTKYLKEVAKILITDYDGDIPPTADQMMDLPGVGPKMSYIIEQVAFGTTSGIGVDTHMHRMFNDLKWVNSTSPEKTREQLEGWLPRERWPEVNVLWVGLGQEVQQQKEKTLRKALGCSRPAEALRLVKRLGLDAKKEGKKFGLEKEVRGAMEGDRGRDDRETEKTPSDGLSGAENKT